MSKGDDCSQRRHRPEKDRRVRKQGTGTGVCITVHPGKLREYRPCLLPLDIRHLLATMFKTSSSLRTRSCVVWRCNALCSHLQFFEGETGGVYMLMLENCVMTLRLVYQSTFLLSVSMAHHQYQADY